MSNHMFTGASNFTISGGNFVNQSHLQISAFDKLSAAAAHSALHDAPARTDESRCHRHTRTTVLDYLERWAQGMCDERASIFWLYGGAGAGKSAIMQTFAEWCVAQGLTLGSFFFSRSDPTRNTAEVLTPTLVYQLAQLFPSALQVLDPIINRDPLIFKKSFHVQLLSLLVHLLQHLVQHGDISDVPQSPKVFLIDGLDECNDPVQQQAIIQAAAAICHEYHVPIKFLIASRPEHAISASFEWYTRENRVLGAIALSEDADAEEDIWRFVEDEFLKIRSQHPFRKMIASKWPDIHDIHNLVRKSSSHFIYASTTMKYIWSAKEDPVRSLQVVLGLEVSRTISPFSELDALYHHILGAAAYRDKVLQILAQCIYAGLPASAIIVCFMLKCSKDDLVIYLADVSSLMVISQSFFYGEEIKLLHVSLGDFLQDQSRSGSLYVNKEVYLASQLERCFHLFDLCSQPQPSMPDDDWSVHLADWSDGYYSTMKDEIITTIEISGHLLETEDVLRRYSLHDFYQCQLRFEKNYQYKGNFLKDLSRFFIAVHSMRTPNAVDLFKRFADDFFDILESYVILESTPLAPAIVTLVFSGYPAQAMRRILADHFVGPRFRRLSIIRPALRYPVDMATARSPESTKTFERVIGIMAMAAPASVRHSINTSHERLAVAAEVILEYLIDQGRSLQLLSMYSTHKSWLQRTKPGKHIATGTPRLASVFHALRPAKVCPRGDPQYIDVPRASRNHALPSDPGPLLVPKYCLTLDERRRLKIETRMVVDLLEALLWLLPKVGFSEKIVLYSKRTFPWNIYICKAGLIRRVFRCLDRYATRVRSAKLEELRHNIDNGDVKALIEQSRMLSLDAQD